MPTEEENRNELERWLAPAFHTYREVCLRHALFTRRTLRVDLLAIPKDENFSDITLAFEVKGHEEWDIPNLAHALKQASDYVLGVVTADPAVPYEHVGKRVMATIVWPMWHARGLGENRSHRDGILEGMRHMAGYHRVGAAYVTDAYKERPLVLTVGNEVWVSSRGWRSDARNILAGKRQLGSQRFNILDELKGIS